MYKKHLLTIGLFFCALFLSPSCAFCEDESKRTVGEEFSKYKFETITTKEGFQFSIPADMPIQRQDGLVKPMDFNQYLYVKFKVIAEKMEALEKKIETLDDNQKRMQESADKILKILKQMEDEAKKEETPALNSVKIESVTKK